MTRNKFLYSIKFRTLLIFSGISLVFISCLWLVISTYRSEMNFYTSINKQKQNITQELNESFSEFSIKHNELYNVLIEAQENPDEEKLYELSRSRMDELDQTVENINTLSKSIHKDFLIFNTKVIQQGIDQLISQMHDYNRFCLIAINQASVDPEFALGIMKESRQLFSHVSLSFSNMHYHLEDETLSQINSQSKKTSDLLFLLIIVVVIAVGTIIITSLLFVRFLSKQLSSIYNTLHAMANGNSDLRCDIKSGNEISSIAQQVNLLADKIDFEKAVGNSKTSFLANMSHEIRTPMSAIIGLSEMISMSHGPKETIEHGRLIFNSSKRLLAVLDDILDFSKIEAHEVKIVQQPFNLKNIVSELRNLFETEAKAKALLLSLDYGDDLPTDFIGDKDRIGQVLNNLIKNALKFTQVGSIDIIVRRLVKKDEHELIQILISDTGVGIGKKDLGNIFKDFFQLEHSRTRKFGGTGLGLAISQRLASLMGGGIEIISELGKGSTFILELPLEEIDVAQPVSEIKSLADNLPQYRKSILLAEDTVVNQVVTKSMMSKLGVDVAIAINGETCIDSFKQKKYDLILMDMHMPVKDGIEATIEIRKIEAEGSLIPTPIVALTASSLETDRRRCLESGMDDVLTKPIGFSKIIEKLDTIWKDSYTQGQ